jgi:Domain of unknown function (DUF4430)
VKRAAIAGLVAAVLAGCGSNHTKGKASLWITRDRGADVVLARTVPAGQTAMQALQRVAKVKTSYGGRYVQSIGGVSGSLSGRHDWFYFVNGYEADRGAADYTLRPGDVEWWDFRSWRHAVRVPVVVGAFPEPFLHGYAGKTRKAFVVFESASFEPEAKGLGRLVHASKPKSRDELKDANLLFLTKANRPFTATGSAAGEPVRFVIGIRDARRLLKNSKLARFRYSGLPRDPGRR